jgi:hypothetical protein
MSEAVQSPRQFSEAEVREVFRRAAELQKGSPVGLSDPRALSLQELEQIALAAGIDVGQVHRAILELDSGEVRERPHLLGAPPQLRLERIVPGEIASAALQNLASEIRRSLGESGQVSTIGTTLKWSASGTSTGPIELTIASAAGKTVIQINARFGGLIGATFGGIGGVLGGGFGLPLAASVGQLSQSVLAGAGTAFASVGLALLLARSIYGAIVRRRIAKLEQLLGSLSQSVAAAAGHSGQ